MDNGEKNVFFTKKKKSILIIVVLCIITAVVFFNQPFGANISREEAIQIAIEYIGGGRANRPDIDWARFQRAWYVEVFYDGFVHSVYVSTRTGDIVRVEIDRWD